MSPAIRQEADGWHFLHSDEHGAPVPYDRRGQLLVGQSLRLADRGVDVRGLHRSLQTLHPERADRLDLRPQQHAVRHALHDVRRLYARFGRACARRFRLHLHEAARPGSARSSALFLVFPPGHHRADLCGVRLRRRFLAHRGTLRDHGGGTAALPFQIGDPDRGRAGDAPGAGRDYALHRVPAHERLACPPGGRRRDRRDRHTALAQRVRGRRVAPHRDGIGARDRRGRPPPERHGRRRDARESNQRGRAEEAMSDPRLGLTMLGLIVVTIMMGFPTAFTLMGLGMICGYIAFWDPSHYWWQNHIFDLIVQRTYGVMTNDTLLSIPLFVYMGYIMERAALIDQMFHNVQVAFRRVPASLAVTTMLVCAFWGIASGIVGAVVILVGVIAMRPMLYAGYAVRLASGAITAGGTLGILIPPSVMLIVYAAVAGQSIVKLYAAAMIPGFFLTFLYLVYILGWANINPKN